MKRFNWERYTRVHAEQHVVLQGMMEYGYAGIDERTKVRYLLAGIKTSALTPCTANLMAMPDI
jgi:branched-subunit amino acid transport protein